MYLTPDEKKLLKKICTKHNVKYNYLIQLFELEKEYSDKNMSRRYGIFSRISECINQWVKEEGLDNDF